MKSINKLLLAISAYILLAMAGCSKEDPLVAETAPIISGLDAEYYLSVRDRLTLTPTIENRTDSVVWLLDGKRVAGTAEYTFEAPDNPGTFSLILKAYNLGNIVQKSVTVTTGRFTNVTTQVNTLLTLNVAEKLSGKTVTWQVLNAPSELHRLTSQENQEGLFIAVDRGVYQIRASAGNIADTVIVAVKQDMTTQSPYITEVFDFLPAPGQFVNELPRYVEGDTHEDMVRKAQVSLKGEDASMISLGGWGGYVVFGFDHTITNVSGRLDFRVHGNMFGANANPDPSASTGGSSEPGIIMVAYDKNKNGKPDDDEWYEIKGSGNFSAEGEAWYQKAVDNKNDVNTFRDFEMTYYRPTTEQPEMPGEVDNPDSYITINDYIRWTNNQGKEGYKVKNVYHDQSYYPAWVSEDELTFKGIRLAQNGIDESGKGNYYVCYAFRYGYVDNQPNVDDNSGIDIDWAIDKDGNKVDLPGIDFVKVYNGIDQENGWLGECSTEVARAEDLHLLGIKIETINQ